MEPEVKFIHVQQVPCASGRTVPFVRQVSRLPRLYKFTPKKRYATASKFNIRGPSIELRRIIFREDLLEWINDKLTPALVKALRPEPQLYQEALDLFYSLKTCSISARNERRVLTMPQSVLERVLSVDLCYGNELRIGTWAFQLIIPHPVISILQQSKLRSLHLVTHMRVADESTPRKIELLVREVILKLPYLATLVVDVPIDAAAWRQDGHTWIVDLISPIREINNAIGITHKWIKSKGQFCIGARWNATKNGTLTWTSEEYWRSIKRENLGLLYNRLMACQQVYLKTQHHPQFPGFNP